MDVRRLIGARQTSHDWYSGGMDHYNGPVDNGHEWKAAASQWVNERNGSPTTSPWINTFDHANELAYNRMREDNYNAFLGNEGGWVGDEHSFLTGNSEGYRDDSIAGWFKGQFAGQDMVQHRRNALRDLNSWASRERAEDGTSQDINKATTRMSQRAFDEMGLAEKYGLSYNDPRPQEYADAYAAVTGGGSTGGGYMGGSFMDNYNAGQAPATGGPRPAAPAGPQVKPGGFMESYLKKKAESKPSVMSLMTELKDA